jgi:hypothetical protein
MDQYFGTPLTRSNEAAGSSAGTTTTVTTSRVVPYTIRGKAYRGSALTNQAFPSTDHTTGSAFTSIAASKACMLILGRNAAGDLVAAQGPSVDLDTNNNYQYAPQFPPIKDTLAPFAYVVCKNGSTGSAWTPGTSNWTATGMTATFVDINDVPDRPQTS